MKKLQQAQLSPAFFVQRPNPKKNMVYGTHAGVDYNITLSPLQSRLQHIYNGQPYASADVSPMPESTWSPSQELCMDLVSGTKFRA